MKISNKMLIVLATITSLVAVSGVLAIFANQQYSSSFEGLENYQRIANSSAQVTSYIDDIEGNLLTYLTLGNETEKSRIATSQLWLEEQIGVLKNEVKTPKSLQQFNYLETVSEETSQHVTQLIQSYDQNPEEFSFENHNTTIARVHYLTEEAKKAVTEIINFETTNLNQAVEQARNSAEFFQTTMVAIMGFTITGAIIIGTKTSCSIAKPIEQLRDTANQIGNGKLGLQNSINAKNEIGELADCLNEMSRKLKQNQDQIINAEHQAAIQTATWVGHDLRNPLQAIQNATYIINKQVSMLPSSSDVREKLTPSLDTINEAVEYSETILKNLRDFGIQQKPHPTKTDITNLIKKTLTQIKTPKNVEITQDFGQIPEIFTDKTMIQKTIMNLVTNAIQAMTDGGKVIVTTQKTAESVEIKLQDTGIGMSKQTITNIYKPFFTTKAKGMGIGLSVCKKFVELNGGSITVKSIEGKGTTFTVKLPISQTNT